jgi:hypothetical protein
MCILPFERGNYMFAIQLICLALLIPKDYTLIYDETPRKFWFHISYMFIISTLHIFEDFFRHWSLIAMTAMIPMIPMIINYNNDPMYYRLLGLGVGYYIISIPVKFLISDNNCKTLFNSKDNTMIKNILKSPLANLLFIYTNKKKYIYIYNFVLLANCIILLKNLHVLLKM